MNLAILSFFYLYLFSCHGTITAAKTEQLTMAVPWYYLQIIWQIILVKLLYFRNSSVHEGIKHNCDECDKEFSRLGALKRHKKQAHEWIAPKKEPKEQKLFKCEECDKEFALSSRLKKHVKLAHMNQRDFECNLCGKAFKEPVQLKVHIRHVHENIKDHVCDK